MENQGTIWAFDLGKGSLGEAVRCGNEFLDTAASTIPMQLAKNKPGEVYPRRACSRNAFGQVYPHGG